MFLPTSFRQLISVAFFLILFFGTLFSVSGQSPPSDFDRERGRMMLNTIKNDLKKNYYDPNFHGMDVDARIMDTHWESTRSFFTAPALLTPISS